MGKSRFPEMYVRIYHSRDEYQSGSVNYCRVFRNGYTIHKAYRSYPVAYYQYRSGGGFTIIDNSCISDKYAVRDHYSNFGAILFSFERISGCFGIFGEQTSELHAYHAPQRFAEDPARHF